MEKFRLMMTGLSLAGDDATVEDVREITNFVEKALQERDRIAREEERKRLFDLFGDMPYLSDEEYDRFKKGEAVQFVKLSEDLDNNTDTPDVIKNDTDPDGWKKSDNNKNI